jgi:hypothetical protein
MLRRLEFFCQNCQTPFTLWWIYEKNPDAVYCPICQSLKCRLEGQYQYERRERMSTPSNKAIRMLSKFPGTCIVCKKPISAGEMIWYEAGVGAAHEACRK